MAPACQYCGSVGGGFRKGTMASVHLSVWKKLSPSSCLDARHSSSLCATGAFQAATPVLELRGRESVLVSPCVGSLRGTAWGSSSFSHWLNPCWFLQPGVEGTYLPGTGGPGVGLVWGTWCGNSSLLRCPSQILSTTCGWGISPFCVCAPPTSLDGCGFFNFIAVKTSIQLDFWQFWVMIVLYFSCNFDKVVQRGEPCLPTLPSWPEVFLINYLERIWC